MRSRKSHTISSREVHEWALNWLLAADLLKDHGWLCSMILRARLLLRNLWVWIHETLLADGRGNRLTVRLERLHFKRLLDWIACRVVALLHDGSTPCVISNA